MSPYFRSRLGKQRWRRKQANRAPAVAGAPGPETAAQLYEEHGAKLLGFLIELLGSKQDAEDVLHDTFGRLMNHKWKKPVWKTILYRVATNRAYDMLRRRKNDGTETDIETLSMELRHPGEQPGEELVRKELVADLNWALQQLSFNQRAAVLLTLYGHTTKEIASILKVTPGSVRNLRSGGHEMLRFILYRLEVTNEC
jgi:RNA polymerase sigma-70 factor (ECF subfamily)